MSKSSDLYPKRQHATIKYTAMLLNRPPHTITYADVDQFKDAIYNMIWTDNLSPAQIAVKLGIPHTNFGMYITKCLHLPLRDLKQAVKNTKVQDGTAKTDAKDIYYAECEFKFSQQEVARIPGFELLNTLGIYHSIKNPNGVVRDHILSKAEAYQNAYDPAHIRHPANCRFITNAENIKKSSNSDITYDQLLERITLWEQNVVPVLSAARRKVIKTPVHIENIRQSIIKRYEDIRTGKIQSPSGGKVKVGRPESFSKKHNWNVINDMIKQCHTLTYISSILDIPRHELSKARKQGLIL